MGCLLNRMAAQTSHMELAYQLARGPNTTEECLDQLERNSQFVPGLTCRSKGSENCNNGELSRRAPSRRASTFSFQHAAISMAGVDVNRRQKTNQDCFLISPNIGFNRDISIYGVFDGHGPDGHLVSKFIRDHLQAALLRQPQLKTDPIQGIHNAISLLCCLLNQRRSIDTSLSGTTCIFLLKVEDQLYCANIGDSRAVLARRSSSSSTGSHSYQFIDLSHDHNLDWETEKDRILRSGGLVARAPGGPGPLRVWLPNGQMPGLAMSRSFGDKVAHLVGVSSAPDIYKHEISLRDEFVIIASDGLWEFLSSEDVVSFVATRCRDWNNLDCTAQRLANMAVLQWFSYHDSVDDITVVVLKIRHHEAEAA